MAQILCGGPRAAKQGVHDHGGPLPARESRLNECRDNMTMRIGRLVQQGLTDQVRADA